MKLGPNQEMWISALKSGDFQQCTGSLQYHTQFCCLGVACKVFKDEYTPSNQSGGWLHGNTLSGHVGVIKHLALYDEVGVINFEQPTAFLDLFSIGGKYHKLNGHTSPASLVSMNDIWGLTFEQIAELVETFPELFFTESK